MSVWRENKNDTDGYATGGYGEHEPRTCEQKKITFQRLRGLCNMRGKKRYNMGYKHKKVFYLQSFIRA